MSGKEKEWQVATRSISQRKDQIMTNFILEEYVAKKYLNQDDRYSVISSDSDSDSQHEFTQLGLRGAFKISRKKLQKFAVENTLELGVDGSIKMEHSFLAIPDSDGTLILAAIMRGKSQDEGIIGHGTQGKVLGIDLIIDGAQYCVKVLPHSEGAIEEHSVMQYLTEVGIKKPQWYFTRSTSERTEDNSDGVRDDRWIYGSEIKDKGYLIQECVPGNPLVDMFDENNPSPLLNDQHFVLKVALCMLLELKNLHNVGVIHNDLNLGNIMVQNASKPEELTVTIIDFGLAKIYKNRDSQEFKVAVQSDLAQLGQNFKDLGIKDDFVRDMRMSIPVKLEEIEGILRSAVAKFESQNVGLGANVHKRKF